MYALTLLMYTVGSPDPRLTLILGEGVNYLTLECNSTLTSAMRGETLTPNPNECNSKLTSGTCGAEPPGPTCTIYTGGGGQLPNPKSAIKNAILR